MAADTPSPKPDKPIRAARWKPTPRTPPTRSNRLLFRLIAIPALAFAGVLIYRGVQDRFVLPDCDSSRAKSTLATVLDQLQAGPVTDGTIKTISSDKTQVACNIALPLADGATLNVDYTFFWQGSNAEMRYSISRQPKGAAVPPAAPPQVPLRTN